MKNKAEFIQFVLVMQLVITNGQKVLVIGTDSDEIEKEIYSNSTIEERYPRENKHSIDPIKTILAKKYLEEIEQQGRQEKPSTRNLSLLRKKIDLDGSKDTTEAKKLLEGLTSRKNNEKSSRRKNNEDSRRSRKKSSTKATKVSACPNCIEHSSRIPNEQQMQQILTHIGDKQYYIGIFFKANWYKAEQYCRIHGMHLASITSAKEQKALQEYIQSYGMGYEHFWTSGTDQGEEGKFYWMSTGQPLTYENWNSAEPNNFIYENGESENCLELWDRDGRGLKWNDSHCSFLSYFICEV